jgi:hypothetical protein
VPESERHARALSRPPSLPTAPLSLSSLSFRSIQGRVNTAILNLIVCGDLSSDCFNATSIAASFCSACLAIPSCLAPAESQQILPSAFDSEDHYITVPLSFPAFAQLSNKPLSLSLTVCKVVARVMGMMRVMGMRMAVPMVLPVGFGAVSVYPGNFRPRSFVAACALRHRSSLGAVQVLLPCSRATPIGESARKSCSAPHCQSGLLWRLAGQAHQTASPEYKESLADLLTLHVEIGRRAAISPFLRGALDRSRPSHRRVAWRRAALGRCARGPPSAHGLVCSKL